MTDVPTNNDERLLAGGLGTPPLKPEFAAGLAAELDAEFLRQKPPAQADHTLAMLLRNKQLRWTANADEPRRQREVAQVRREVRRLSSEPAKTAPLGRRLALVASVAALMMASVWNQPRYNWERSLDAVRQQPWVAVTEVSTPGQEKQQGSVTQIATRQASRFSETAAAAAATHPVIKPDTTASLAHVGRRRPRAEIAADLFALFTGANQEQTGGELQVDEARPVPSETGVELDLTLRRGDTQVRVRLLIDPATHLPLACDVVAPLGHDQQGLPPRRYVFGYPAAADGADHQVTGAAA